jgi:hypothetical protein
MQNHACHIDISRNAMRYGVSCYKSDGQLVVDQSKAATYCSPTSFVVKPGHLPVSKMKLAIPSHSIPFTKPIFHFPT